MITFRIFFPESSLCLTLLNFSNLKDLSPMTWLNVTFITRKARRINETAIAVDQSAKKRFATESVENVSASKSMRLCNAFNQPHRLSMRLDDAKWPSRASSRINDGLPTKNDCSLVSKRNWNYKGRGDWTSTLKIPSLSNFSSMETVETKTNCFYQEVWNCKSFHEKLNCSISIAANFSCKLTLGLPKDVN